MVCCSVMNAHGIFVVPFNFYFIVIDICLFHDHIPLSGMCSLDFMNLLQYIIKIFIFAFTQCSLSSEHHFQPEIQQFILLFLQVMYVVHSNIILLCKMVHTLSTVQFLQKIDFLCYRQM